MRRLRIVGGALVLAVLAACVILASGGAVGTCPSSETFEGKLPANTTIQFGTDSSCASGRARVEVRKPTNSSVTYQIIGPDDVVRLNGSMGTGKGGAGEVGGLTPGVWTVRLTNTTAGRYEITISTRQ